MSSFLQNLRKRGIEVRLVNREIRIGPKEKVTEHILRIAREHKVDIFSEFSAEMSTTRVQASIDEQGWCAIKSRVLDEVILLIRDEETPIPPEHWNKVTYTLSELVHLHGCPAELLRRLNRLKKVVAGRIIGPDGYPFPE